MIKDIHKSPIWILSRWGNEYSYDTFNYYIHDYFNPELQKVFIKDGVFSNEELKYMLFLYIKMKVYFENQEDVWNMDLKDSWAKEIEDIIIKFLSLPSMERFMREERKNPYYKWIWKFY